MIPNAIEREILIEAPVQTVWSVVTEPSQISSWLSDTADIDLRPGGQGTLVFTDRASNQHATVRLLVESVEPPHTFAFRWDHPADEEAREGNSLHPHCRGREHQAAGHREWLGQARAARGREGGLHRRPQQGLGHSPGELA